MRYRGISGMNTIINSFVSGVNINACGNLIVINGVVVSGGGECIEASDKMISRKLESIGSFDSILNMTTFNVEYTEVETEAETEVEVIAPDNIMDIVVVEVEDNCLSVYIKQGKNFSCGYDNTPRVVIKGHLVKDFTNRGSGDMVLKGTPAFDTPTSFSLDSRGSGRIDAHEYNANFRFGHVTIEGSGEILVGTLKGDSIDASISGSGDISLDKVECKSFSVSISGSGNVDVSGTASRVDFSIFGSGDISARRLKAEKGKASISGSGNIWCCVKSMSEHCHGSGDVYNIG